MNKKALPYIFLAVLVVAALLIKQCNATGGGTNRKPSNNKDHVNRNRGLDRRVAYLEYTQHAKCMMQCRQVTQEEVQFMLQNGQINYKKSQASGRPCPTYAVEGYSPDKQHLRMVFAQCDTKTKVVTCIDLDQDFECHCPGDENKNDR